MSKDLTVGFCRGKHVEDIYNYVEDFCVEPAFPTPHQNSIDHHQLGKQFHWQMNPKNQNLSRNELLQSRTKSPPM